MYTYKEDRNKWFKLTVDNVKEIIDLNKNNVPATSLEDYEFELLVEKVVEFEDVVGQDSLTRFDIPKKRKNKQKNKHKNSQSPGQPQKGTGSPKNKKQRPPNRSANTNKNT